MAAGRVFFRMVEPETYLLPAGNGVPNHPRFPALIYRAVTVDPAADTASAFEAHLARNGWPAQWRNGVYPFHHYHATAHEVLAIAQGTARLLLGGPDGVEVTVNRNDVIVLPAGTGHCRLSSDDTFLVVGGYPPGQEADLHREPATDRIRETLRAVPHPESDPVSGKHGPLLRLWA